MDFTIGQRVKSKEDTLAYFAGDRTGTIEKLDGTFIRVRMDQSGRLVPFRKDQLSDAIDDMPEEQEQ